jgi:hypothetical protein
VGVGLRPGGGDVTPANPLGPPVRGWADVSDALRPAASQLSDGDGLESEQISGYSGDDLAYTLGLERCSRLGVQRTSESAGDELRPVRRS